MTTVGPSSPGSAKFRSVLLLVCVLSAILTAYSNALDGPFLWDDRQLILENPSVLSPETAWSPFVQPFWTKWPSRNTRCYYRPLTTLSYILDFRIWGPSPAGFHGTNVAVHLLNVTLLFFLARRWGASFGAAGLAAVLWGLSPRLTESVTWISGRTDVLAAAPVLAGLLLWSPVNRPRRLGVAFCFAMALLFKEVGLSLAVSLAVLESAKARGEKRPFKGALLKLWPLGVIFAAFIVVRQLVLPHQVPEDSLGWKRVLTVFQALATGAEMILDPLRPRGQIGLVRSVDTIHVIAGIVLSLILAAVARHAWRKWSPEILAALALSATSLLLVVHILPLTINVIAADRFLYLPLAGLAAALALGARRLSRRTARGAAVVAMAVAVAFSVRVHERNRDWGNEFRFWRVTVLETGIGNFYFRSELARVLFRTGRFDEMVRVWETIPYQDPETAALTFSDYSNLGTAGASALDVFGHYEEAATVLWLLAANDPGAPSLVQAGVMAQSFDIPGAMKELERSERLSPSGLATALRFRLENVESELSSLHVNGFSSPGSLADIRVARIVAQLGGIAAETAWLAVLGSPHTDEDGMFEAASRLVERGSPRSAKEAMEVTKRSGFRGLRLQALLEAYSERRADDREIQKIMGFIDVLRRQVGAQRNTAG